MIQVTANDTSLRDDPEDSPASWNPWFCVAGGANTVKLMEAPRIILRNNVGPRFAAMAASVSSEISCLATVTKDGLDFCVEDLLMFDQVCSPVATTLDQAELTKFTEGLLASGNKDQLPNIKGWFHSHPKMTPFWSGTDDSTCRRIVTDWLVSIVMADNFKMKGRIDFGGSLPMVIDDVPIFVEYGISEEAWNTSQALAKKHVTMRSISLGTGYLGHQWMQDYDDIGDYTVSYKKAEQVDTPVSPCVPSSVQDSPDTGWVSGKDADPCNQQCPKIGTKFCAKHCQLWQSDLPYNGIPPCRAVWCNKFAKGACGPSCPSFPAKLLAKFGATSADYCGEPVCQFHGMTTCNETCPHHPGLGLHIEAACEVGTEITD